MDSKQGSVATVVAPKHWYRCALGELKPVKFLASATASPSDIWISEDKDSKTVLKIYLKPNKAYPRSHGLMYESQIYKLVTRHLLEPVSRNFVELESFCEGLSYSQLEALLKKNKNKTVLMANLTRNINWFFCNEKKRPALDDSKKTLSQKCQRIVTAKNFRAEDSRYNVTVTRYRRGTMSLFELFRKNRMSARDFEQTMFQLAYGLASLHSLKISHQDFHARNVLMVPVEKGENVNVLYAFGKKREAFFVNRKWYPLMFDWDNATSEFEKNPKFEQKTVKSKQPAYRMSNRVEYVRDVFWMARSFSLAMAPKTIRDIFFPSWTIADVKAMGLGKKHNGYRDHYRPDLKMASARDVMRNIIGMSEDSGFDFRKLVTLEQEATRNQSDWHRWIFTVGMDQKKERPAYLASLAFVLDSVRTELMGPKAYSKTKIESFMTEHDLDQAHGIESQDKNLQTIFEAGFFTV